MFFMVSSVSWYPVRLMRNQPFLRLGFHHREHREHGDGWEGRIGSDSDPIPFPSGLCDLCGLCGETPDRASGRSQLVYCFSQATAATLSMAMAATAEA